MRKLSIFLSLLIILMAIPLPACIESAKSSTIKIDNIGKNINEASLAEIWAGVIESIDIQDSSANLHSLHLIVGEGGCLDYISVQFLAIDSQGRNGWYNLSGSFYLGEDIDGYYFNTDHTELSTHPLAIFRELDMLQMKDIMGESEQLIISMRVQAGHTGYGDYYDVYHIENGQRTPLKFVLFPGNRYFGDIWVTNAGESEVWFTTSELDKAETVEYL